MGMSARLLKSNLLQIIHNLNSRRLLKIDHQRKAHANMAFRSSMMLWLLINLYRDCGFSISYYHFNKMYKMCSQVVRSLTFID